MRLAVRFLWFLAWPVCVAAADDDSLRSLKQTLGEKQAQMRQAEKSVEELDREVARISTRLLRLQGELAAKRQKLKSLEKRVKRLEADTQGSEASISRHIRAAYFLGRQSQVKLILNQEDPNTIGRMMTYYEYLNRAQLAELERLRGTLLELERAGEQLQQETVSRQQLVAAQRLEKEELEVQRVKRKRLVTALAAEVERTRGRLASLNDNRKRLDRIAGGLDGGIVSGTSFAQNKGRLPWPVRGKIKARFGATRSGTRLKWRGMLISAAEGTPVQSVAAGKVVFADWLRGYGFLVIVDHGNDYMSLYGHNQLLRTRVGQKVTAGELIAQVGASGGLSEAALYFEIRRRGQAINPQRWMMARR